jgi:hypothetical protein
VLLDKRSGYFDGFRVRSETGGVVGLCVRVCYLDLGEVGEDGLDSGDCLAAWGELCFGLFRRQFRAVGMCRYLIPEKRG